ncbi:MAG: M20/M25/M40 family metallo-hydrolase [Planctomycetales bacterium]|nr:M20/M25/M40 family metallo-hydrolase [Planctomycetales bacterium]
MNRIQKIAKRGGLISLAILTLLAGILGWNCWRFPSQQIALAPLPKLKLDEAEVLSRFQGAIRIPTISISMARMSEEGVHQQFRHYIETTFPTLHSAPFLVRTGTEFGDALNPSVLLEWPGQDPSLGGILVMSHSDVVPIEEDSLDQWSHAPFGGDVDESYIWGRGTLDCKHGLMAILEALSLLAAEDFQPQRTIYFAMGHDEEILGREGNRKIAEWFRSRGRRIHSILDEGGCIFTEFPGLDRPAALIGVAEKGYLEAEVTVHIDSNQVGHASMPPGETAVSILATAIDRLQASPLPARIDGGLRDTIRFLGPEMPSLSSRIAMSNLWLCEPLVKHKLGAKPSGNALLRSTVAPTMIEAGVRSNVLPAYAKATLNIRLLPGDSIEGVLAHLRNAVKDERVEVVALPNAREASPVSSSDAEAFELIQKSAVEVFPDVVVAPFVLVGATDTVHYTDLCQNIYRFIPTRLSERDTKRFHGIDERIGRENYFDIVRFFHRYLSTAATK